MTKEDFVNATKKTDVAKKNAQNEAKRLEAKVKAYNSSEKNNNVPELSKSPSSNNQGSEKNKNMKENLKKKVATKALAATTGVPEEVGNKLYDLAQTEQGKKFLKSNNKRTFGPIAGNLMNRLMYGKEEKEEEDTGGVFGTSSVFFKKIKNIAIFATPILTVFIFCILFVAASQVYLNAIGIGQADETSASDAEDKINDKGEENLDQEISDETAYIDNITIHRKKYAVSYVLNTSTKLKTNNTVREDTEVDLSELEDFYGANLLYDETSNMETVYKFYYKLHDIYVRYANKQRVELDIPLLMSTLMLQSKDMNIVFVSNTSDYYDRTNIDIIESSVLDYDHDWSDYKITYSNSAHDIEILAQNMVSEDGNGQYRIDYEKYDEFLKEFLEKKYFLDDDSNYFVDEEDSSNSNWRSWTQCGQSWSNYKLGASSETMCQSGCLVTAITMQIARSGTAITTDSIDPGIASKKFNFTGTGALYWGSVKNLSPNFYKKTEFSLAGLNKAAVASKLSNYNSKKQYLILQVTGSGSSEHYVALDYVDYNTNEIYIIDPASTSRTKLYDHYKVVAANVFEKKD